MLVWFINYVNNRVMRWYSLQATLRLKRCGNVLSFSKISSAVIMNSPPKTMSFIALQAIKVVITSVE
jgi:hypothetical protein